MNGFEWLNQLMQWLARWVPRLVLVRAGSVLVRFRSGGRADERPAGLYVYWPILTEVQIVSKRTRTIEIAGQLIGRESVALVVAYAIDDALAVALRYNDLFSFLDDRIQVALCAAYGADVRNDSLAAAVRAELTDLFEPSVRVISVDVISRGRVIPLKNINDWAQHATSTLE